jgi:4-diphosphocytidyl-2-C-methyl-D-erythritol kinase
MTTADAGGQAQEFAPAKINLTLHVTGQRADGYHLLDSLVVFADIGDRISVVPCDTLAVSVTGPMAAGVPVGDGNLVLRAARAAGVDAVRVMLDKHLPTAAGIGGGSSDAAATLRALRRSHAMDMPDAAGLLRLGADVPACLLARTLRMSGIGGNVAAVQGVPALPTVLVNPAAKLGTPEVFQALRQKRGAAMPAIPAFEDVAACVAWLKRQRNDLEDPARRLAPDIADVLAALAASGALLARMSGSGATCFGLFETRAAAARVARLLQADRPGWWVRETVLAR